MKSLGLLALTIVNLAAFSVLTMAAEAGLPADAALDLPRFPPVPAERAVSTWKVKEGFAIQLAASEPQVRDPIAICFDENGRMFVCEMIDYPEQREVTPHLGRISLLEDHDGDGFYETSRVFADNLAWPTGLIWAGGGLFVASTPDILRFEDRDGDGRAEVRETVFTGFGGEIARLNVQALLNSLQWGPDNRVHLLSGIGNRGRISSPRRPDLPAQELGARDFWFDPRTYEFGFEEGGAQYGMGFDNEGRKYASSNSDHLQYWVYDDRYAHRNPFRAMPPARKSIAVDGGAAEVFRISPDEPWRIIRTRWRVGGVVKGMIEGGGRVSGYFTGATGTMVYRGDAYGAEFLDNTFTGDAGGQLIHRKIITDSGVSREGRRPADELNREFAASTDTWVRVVNLANAPDGTLHVCDMYREVIEHPWSIPESIKRHLDLTSGNDRGRIYRIVPVNASWHRRSSVSLGSASTRELVATLGHPNGWHRDTASRLLCERQDAAAIPLLRETVQVGHSRLATLHALSVLATLRGLDERTLASAIKNRDASVRERGIRLIEIWAEAHAPSAELIRAVAGGVGDDNARVRFQMAFTLPALLKRTDASSAEDLRFAYTRLAERDGGNEWMMSALLSGPPEIVTGVLLTHFLGREAQTPALEELVAALIEMRAAMKPAEGYAALIDRLSRPGVPPRWVLALGAGVRRAGLTFEAIDTRRRLAALFVNAAKVAGDGHASLETRTQAVELLSVASDSVSLPALASLLSKGYPESLQLSAIGILAQKPPGTDVMDALLGGWRDYSPTVRHAVIAACLSREDRAASILAAVDAKVVSLSDFAASHVEALTHNAAPPVRERARIVLSSLIPPSRPEVLKRYFPAVAMTGDAGKGREVFQGRCLVCHRAEGKGSLLGPDMVTVKSRGREGVLTAIVDPNREVASQYISYEVSTRDGSAYSGIISQDDASGLTLKIMGGIEMRILRSQVTGVTSSGRSLMPEGLEAGLSINDMADLLTYIESL
ncbi:MAG: c-type cytochrome [Opitutaceae bacterium]|nr:c-type cytochrome [Opitutaceae bacterium]